MLALCAIFLSAALVGAVPVVNEDPIVSLIKEVIYEADQYIAKNNLDTLPIPDIGRHFWEPLQLRNGRISNFSSLELLGTPVVKQIDLPDNSTLYTFKLLLGLNKVAIEYDLSVSLLYLIAREGSAIFSTEYDSAKVDLEIIISQDGNCKAILNNAAVEDFGELSISLYPDDFPEVTQVSQAILNVVSPNLVPITNLVINNFIHSTLFQELFSHIVCKNVPL